MCTFYNLLGDADHVTDPLLRPSELEHIHKTVEFWFRNPNIDWNHPGSFKPSPGYFLRNYDLIVHVGKRNQYF